MATLRAEHLKKSYKSRTVIQDVSMSVESGQVVGLLGPNGAGKTTCFYMIVGLVQSDAGAIFIDDQDITFNPVHHRSKMGLGYLPQEASIFRKMTVEENIYSILEFRKDLNKTEKKHLLSHLLEEFNITHIKDSLGMALSGGERRRAEIARALATDPKFILLDEPFAGVDPISVIDIKRIIEQLKSRGLGVLITDHNVRETLDVCEKAYIISAGHVIAHGSADEVLSNQQVRKVYLGDQFRL